ncbi:MAG: SDR family oxidoreductase [Anaerolineae bacterium]|nr:SDR family oxidoreductase [Anaerolineae bacterium]
MQLKDKVALVTGAAHRVGKAIALALAQEGTNIVLHYGGSVDAARQTADEIASLGVEVFPYQANLSDPSQIAALFDAVQGRFARLDVLVNSASSFERRPFDEITAEDWDRVMAVNLRAPFLCSRHAARLMHIDPPAPREAGLIVNIADHIGISPRLGFAQHGVSKAALIHLTKAAALELAPDIRVNAVVPGPVMAPADMDPQSEAWEKIWSRVPLNRPGDPADVGRAVVFLAAGGYMTGALIPVDGGEGIIGVPGSDK